MSYRETLASLLTDWGKPREAAAILSEVSGEEHPMIPLLLDLAAVPIPDEAELVDGSLEMTYWATLAEAGIMDHLELRLRTYRLSMTPEEVETFYRSHWSRFRFSDEDFGPVLLRWQDGTLKPAVPTAEDPARTPKDGLLMMLFEPDEEMAEVLNLSSENEPLCFLHLINFRKCM